ncbi:MAG: SDR family oxidoreductase [Methylotenera sp.]|nr:SDR family oxidoreductase [Methylotenera sp.]MDO9232171.1 SDR family oxidoreductase [Methylotenera sp.]MDO9388672.1 SDR family oxidoreductase [Methylotenera sp.]MDP2101131.1 SDR family oxidoreductase [Methylotenera sp.]MDP2280309.1 SDR family oxidoreductase [Methylotenera sp.]
MASSVATKILIIGCGDLGTAVAQQLVQSGVYTIGVRRSAVVIDGVLIIQADVTQPDTLESLRAIQPEIVVYCVAAEAQMDAAYKAAYVDGLRHVLATQISNPNLKHVFFVSSTRVYGQNTDTLLDESILATPADFGGERLLEAESLLQSLACPATTLRLSGIYGPRRLRMINLAQSPERWPHQNSWSNRIHRDDAAAFIVFLIQQVLAGITPQACYVVTDSQPVTQYEVLNWIAAKLGVAPQTIPAAAEGKRLSNQAMLATGFQLQYPTYQAGYQALLLNELTVNAIS